MLKANPIRKRAERGWFSLSGAGPARLVRRWVAACPECAKEIYAGEHNGRGYLRGHTRKQAKDALYRHVQKEHKRGSVGRPTA